MREPAPDRDPLRDNQTLDDEQLRARAREAFDASGKTQAEVGLMLDPPVTFGAVSRALSLNEPAGRYAPLQRRIVAALTDYTVEDEPRPVLYRLRKKRA